MPRKLIESTLPLNVLNDASAYDKMPGIGRHPKNMHQWWARLPLPAARAVLFASIVNDPWDDPELRDEEESTRERRRAELFAILDALMARDAVTDEQAWARARAAMLRDTGGALPRVVDPFSGGGSIPLEAHRLALESYGSDLNPVAVTISKALFEFPSRFSGMPPVNPDSAHTTIRSWDGAAGLAADVLFYGRWMSELAEKRIGHLFPSAKVAGGKQLSVLSWLWARVVTCPNPACAIQMPLVRSFALSSKPTRPWRVTPVVENGAVRFAVSPGPARTGTVTRQGAVCIACQQPVGFDYLRAEAKAGRMAATLMATVADSDRGRVYLSPEPDHEKIAASCAPVNVPDTPLPAKALGFRVQAYGKTRHRDLFTARQLVVMETFSDLVIELRERIRADATPGMGSDSTPLVDGGAGAAAYADAVATYLAFAVDRMADFNCAHTRWAPAGEQVKPLFARQTISMTWDFPESNPFATKGISWNAKVRDVADGIKALGRLNRTSGGVSQLDARLASPVDGPFLISTDPPYYDNIGYAALADFFYVWLRRTTKDWLPSLTATLLTPKQQELVASAEMFAGDTEEAQRHFESGFVDTFRRLATQIDARFPMTVFYAYKQTADDTEEMESAGVGSTGWETMLESLIRAGFQITATWPIHASQRWRMRSLDSNALATYIVLACRSRPTSAPLATRREFLAELKATLPGAVKRLKEGNIAAVDLAQAAIGPGMAIFSRYARVIEADGSTMRVQRALQLINQALDEAQAQQEAEYDLETQWAVSWFEQFGAAEALFGDAETLSKAKNTSMSRLVEVGLVRAAKGKVQLTGREQIDAGWDPTTDRRLTVWELVQHLIARLLSGGENAAADLLRKVGGMGEIARDLAYRLYSVAERKRWTEEAIAYNSLVVAWPEITRLAAEKPATSEGEQMSLR